MASLRVPEFAFGTIDVPDELERLATVLVFRGVVGTSAQISLTRDVVSLRFDNEADLREIVSCFPRDGEGPFSNAALHAHKWEVDSKLAHVFDAGGSVAFGWSPTVRFPLAWADKLARRLAHSERFYILLARDELPADSGVTGTATHVNSADEALAALAAGRDGTHADGRYERGRVLELRDEPLRIVELEGFGHRRWYPSV
jgi:hypothetical protein